MAVGHARRAGACRGFVIAMRCCTERESPRADRRHRRTNANDERQTTNDERDVSTARRLPAAPVVFSGRSPGWRKAASPSRAKRSGLAHAWRGAHVLKSALCRARITFGRHVRLPLRGQHRQDRRGVALASTHCFPFNCARQNACASTRLAASVGGRFGPVKEAERLLSRRTRVVS